MIAEETAPLRFILKRSRLQRHSHSRKMATSEATEPTTLSSVDDLPAETRRTMAARTSEDMSPETEEMLRWAAASLPDYVADEFSPLTGDPSFAPLLWPVAAPQRDPVLKAVAACGSSLARVPTSERRRRSIVEAAAAQDEEALVYASPKLLGDREFMLSQCIFSGRRLRFASKRLRDDKEVVSMALRSFGSALQWASPRLRRDPELCWAAVMNHGCALHHVPRRLRESREFVLAVRRGDNRRGVFHRRGGDVYDAARHMLGGDRSLASDDGFAYERDVAKPKMAVGTMRVKARHVAGKSACAGDALWCTGQRHGRLEGRGGWVPPVGGNVKGTEGWYTEKDNEYRQLFSSGSPAKRWAGSGRIYRSPPESSMGFVG